MWDFFIRKIKIYKTKMFAPIDSRSKIRHYKPPTQVLTNVPFIDD